jgi:hypothetical protein
MKRWQVPRICGAQAKYKADGREYAVKVIMKDKCHKEGELEKVQDEINIMKKGTCPRTRALPFVAGASTYQAAISCHDMWCTRGAADEY